MTSSWCQLYYKHGVVMMSDLRVINDDIILHERLLDIPKICRLLGRGWTDHVTVSRFRL